MWRLQDVFHCISRFFPGLPSSGLLGSFTGAECHTAQKKLGESGEEERRGGEGSGVEGSRLGGSKALAKAARKGRGSRGEGREWKRRETMHEDGERKTFGGRERERASKVSFGTLLSPGRRAPRDEKEAIMMMEEDGGLA